LRGRDILRREVDAALASRDGLILPALAIPAPKLGAVNVRIGGSDEPIRTVMLRLTQLFNITGHPAITLPCGGTTDGLPVGFQIAGRAGDTLGLLRLARAVEDYVGPGRSGCGVGRSGNGCGGISGGGAGLRSDGEPSSMSGDPGGRGTSGFLGCSIMPASAATRVPGAPIASLPVS
jgi:hypothetical protein